MVFTKHSLIHNAHTKTKMILLINAITLVYQDINEAKTCAGKSTYMCCVEDNEMIIVQWVLPALQSFIIIH